MGEISDLINLFCESKIHMCTLKSEKYKKNHKNKWILLFNHKY